MGDHRRKASLSSKKILLIPIALSVLTHVLVLSATGLVDMHFGGPKKETTITVNLAKTENDPEDKKDKAPEQKLAPAPLPQAVAVNAGLPGEEEKTLSIDSPDENFAPYLRKIKKKIESGWSYPHQAFARQEEGTSAIVFSLGNSGALVASKLVTSSGHDLLDHEAIRAVQAAAPFEPFPETIAFSRLNIQATFRYNLTD